MKHNATYLRHGNARSPRTAGFTLVELMIVVVIIGILAAIAYPGYKNYVIKANRSAAGSFLMEVASREKQYLLDARQYIAATSHAELSSNLKVSVPSEVGTYYTVTVTTGSAPPSFDITATPVSSKTQAGDGTLHLLDTGSKTRMVSGVDKGWK